MTGTDVNGPGLSDGNVKNTLRGLPDGNFAMTYDGIAFGDTNGPTHHNIAYFPASTIGSAVVDRGPGNAGTLASNTYGGTVKLFSEDLSDTPQAKGVISYGSFGTVLEDVNGQSGDLDDLGLGHAKVLVNLQDMKTDGALSLQYVAQKNALLKIQDEIAPHWTVTLFGNYEHLYENLDDNNGATPAQVAVYGKGFALQKTDPTLPTYVAYNYTTKATDLDYFRVNGDITDGLKLENTAYTYAYWNHTFSPNSQTQTLAQIQGDTSADNGTVVAFNGTSHSNNLLAYNKENYYRVYGDMLRLAQDYDFGWVSGQVRTGLWWETSATHRFKYYYDANLCAAEGVSPFSGPAGAEACGAQNGSAQNGVLGWAKDDEYSDWTQYEPYLEVDIKPTDNLTLTPGVKYIHWDRGVDAPVAQGSNCGVAFNNVNKAGKCPNDPGQNYTAGFITRDTLPFFEANYKIEPSWSVYAQYAQGIYVPDISTFENKQVATTYPAPETTTNYQLGTVYYADNFNFDADVYYIPINNNYIPVLCSVAEVGGSPNDTCYLDNGKATYKGIEGEGNYSFDELYGVDLHGLNVFANGALMSSKSAGKWEPNAPNWTAAAGILYKQNGWKFSLIEKLVGPQYSDTANTKQYEMQTYGNLNGTIGYSYGPAELYLSADNLLDSRKTTAITINDKTYQPDRMNSTDQYFFQAPRSVMLTLKVHM